ncbi:putative gpi anchored protein [Erysiphe neolycopersici]|uniref:Putative gpi anchored protein n=1 Tax=Erysiphe neolycopersici TaxID=212602 RepID=A0A420HC01_9PEZI|nr:putative gpi anchored protein [Erysiphe neolycopersici]
MRSILIARAIASSTLILPILCTVSAKSPADNRHLKQWHRSPYLDEWSENLFDRRRDLGEDAGLKGERNRIGVMKMTADEGQKFFPEYWLYEGEDPLVDSKDSHIRFKRDEDTNSTSAPMIPALRPLIQPKTSSFLGKSQGLESKADRVLERRSADAVLATLQKRDFQCPTGTADCSAIGHPNSCCPLSDACFAIEDTGLGPVGCCRRGKKCGGTLNNCNASNTACPSNLGGGCCIQNYLCGGVGCVINPTLIITTVITVTTMISSSSAIATITTTSIPTFSYTPDLDTYPTSSEAETPGEHICAPGNNCNLSPVAPTSALSADHGNIPVRPTSLDSSLPSISLDNQTCPTGFYACEAFYVGGCCRTGRNCDTTSCPPRTSTSLVADNVTIQIPVATETATEKSMGSCATGWASCAVNEGGGCCPSGWKCGLTNCLDEKAKATTTINKENQSSAAKKVIIVFNVYISMYFIVVVLMYLL